MILVASCGNDDTSVDTSRLSDREKEWVEFSYAHEKNQDVKEKWERLPADGVKSYLDEQLPLLCGDTAALMESLQKAGHSAEEMRDYKQKTSELVC
ncbi:hypothetical protein [Streptomyces sp. NPDC056549]|uniref:hypothetical protein n=1 Tax=Streptomyces sp. NPDC056549 TaxID=3345864 RepID=UPI003698C7DA